MTPITTEALIAGTNIRVKRTRHGFVLYNVHDAYVGRSFDLYGEFSEEETRLFALIVKPGMTVVDIGANIGAHTLFFAAAVGPSGLVIAFEPQRVLYQMLCANLALNEITNVRPLQMGAGRESGQAFVPAVDYAKPGNFGGIALATHGLGEQVTVAAIDQISLDHCHFMKIDVEGMEEEAILGAKETISRHRPILYVENDRREKSPALIRRLLDMSYRLHWHTAPLFSAENVYNDPHNVFPTIVSVNMLCVPREMNQNIARGNEIAGPDDWPLAAPRSDTGARGSLPWTGKHVPAHGAPPTGAPSEPSPRATPRTLGRRLKRMPSPTADVMRAFDLEHAGDIDEAAQAYAAILKTDPWNPYALHRHAVLSAQHGHHAEALTLIETALKITPVASPTYAQLLSDYGLLLHDLQRYEDAVAAFDRALILSPKLFSALFNRANTLRQLGRPHLALASAAKALAIKPDDAGARFEQALAALTLGDFATGWASYEWRWNTPECAQQRRDFPQPLWHGREAISGRTILLHAEQGFGDTIQFVRYAPLVAQLGATVVLEVQADLVPLLAGMRDVASIVARGDALPAFDLHCPLMSLPLAFATRLDTIPATCPYLSAPADLVAAWRGRLPAARLLVGLVWSGRPSHRNDRSRSIALARLLPLLATTGLQFVSLQRDIRAEDAAVLRDQAGVLGVGRELATFADTAAVISALDLVISVDTSVAHLAGALAKPVFVLLPVGPDFRWLLDRCDSPWYPSARLFRQPRPDDWESVVARVRGELEQLVPASCAAT